MTDPPNKDTNNQEILDITESAQALENLAEPIMITKAVRNKADEITDFVIMYANDNAFDPEGGSLRERIGQSALELDLPGSDPNEAFTTWARVVETETPGELGPLTFRQNVDGYLEERTFTEVTVKFGDGCLHTLKDETHLHTLQHELAQSRQMLDDFQSDRESSATSNAATQGKKLEVGRDMLRALNGSAPAISASNIPGVSLGVRSDPFHRQVKTNIRGDWYDVLPLSDGAFFVVGDAMGSGIESGRMTTHLPDVIRAYVLLGLSPGEVLTESNNYLMKTERGRTATALCCRLRSATGELQWAQAGIPDPLVVNAHGSQYLSPPEGATLGTIPDLQYETAVETLEDETTLLCFSDGLIDAREKSLAGRLREILDAAFELKDLSPQTMCDTLIRRVAQQGEVRDDVSILAIRVEGTAQTPDNT